MAFGMFVATLVLTITTTARAAGHYERIQNKNAFSDKTGYKGADHLEHCEVKRTHNECETLCDNDCDCHCFIVYMGGDTEYTGNTTKPCFLRRNCTREKMEGDEINPSPFDVYVKTNDSNDCFVYEDKGFERTCVGGSDEKIATNVGSLEECKAICNLLSFECKGIEYTSNCSDHTQDQCKMFSGGDIIRGDPSQPQKNSDHVNVVTHHCLKYNGTVGTLSGGLMVPMYLNVNGVDAALVIGAGANAIGAETKTVVASQHRSLSESDITVLLSQTGTENVSVEIEIKLQQATNFHEVRRALIENEETLKNDIKTKLEVVNSTIKIGNGPFVLTAIKFNLTNAEFFTTTTTGNDTTAETTTAGMAISGTHQIQILATMFMWTLGAQHISF